MRPKVSSASSKTRSIDFRAGDVSYPRKHFLRLTCRCGQMSLDGFEGCFTASAKEHRRAFTDKLPGDLFTETLAGAGDNSETPP